MANAIRNILFGGLGAATTFGDIGLAIARIGIGGLMAAGHGYGKIFHDKGFGPDADMVQGVGEMGFPMPVLFAWLAALAEFLGGILIALGLMTRPVAFALTFNMAVAAFIAHGKDPLLLKSGMPAKELALLFLLPFLMFFFTGAGRFSLDALLRRTRRARPAFEVGSNR